VLEVEESSGSLLLYLSPIVEKILSFANSALDEFPWASAAAIRLGVELIVKSLYLDLLHPRYNVKRKVKLLESRKFSFRYIARKLEEKAKNRSFRDKVYSLWLDSTKYSHFTEYVARELFENDIETTREKVKRQIQRLEEVWKEALALGRERGLFL